MIAITIALIIIIGCYIWWYINLEEGLNPFEVLGCFIPIIVMFILLLILSVCWIIFG
jgi:hypothetical protein